MDIMWSFVLMMWREFANFSLPESVQLFCNNWHDCRHMILCCTLSSTFETVLNTIYRTDTLIPLNLIAANLSKERITWLRTFLLQSRQMIIMKKSGLNWEKKCVRTAERGFNCITRREYSLWSGAITKASVLIVTMKCNCFIVHAFCRNDFFFKSEMFHSILDLNEAILIRNFPHEPKEFMFNWFLFTIYAL